MRFRQLEQNGDWTFGKGANSYAQENRAIGLNIRTRILSWFGDCFFDQGAGIDWVNRVGSKSQKDILEADLRNTILQSEGVTGILSFDVTLIDRNFRADYSVQTIYSKSYTDLIEVTI